MKNYQKILLTCALVMLIGAGIRPALSYFTTYVDAKGTVAISLEENGKIEESVENLTKKIVITNTGEPEVYVRVQAFVASSFASEYEPKSNKWSKGEDDNWWYYSEPVAPGASTDEIDFTITGLPKDRIGQYDFNVVIVYETAPVIYNADGSYVAPKSEMAWSQTKETNKIEDKTEGGH